MVVSSAGVIACQKAWRKTFGKMPKEASPGRTGVDGRAPLLTTLGMLRVKLTGAQNPTFLEGRAPRAQRRRAPPSRIVQARAADPFVFFVILCSKFFLGAARRSLALPMRPLENFTGRVTLCGAGLTSVSRALDTIFFCKSPRSRGRNRQHARRVRYPAACAPRCLKDCDRI